MNLFAYGSYIFPPVLHKVLAKYKPRSAATLEGYTRVAVKGCYDPALIKMPGVSIAGCVYSQLSGQDFKHFDVHEGQEYSRILLPVMVKVGPQTKPKTIRAYVYFLDRPAAAVEPDLKASWCPVDFSQQVLPRFLCRNTCRTQLRKLRRF